MSHAGTPSLTEDKRLGDARDAATSVAVSCFETPDEMAMMIEQFVGAP